MTIVIEVSSRLRSIESSINPFVTFVKRMVGEFRSPERCIVDGDESEPKIKPAPTRARGTSFPEPPPVPNTLRDVRAKAVDRPHASRHYTTCREF